MASWLAVVKKRCQQTNFDSQSNVIKLTYAQKKKTSKPSSAAAA